jgi:Alpha/beta hydrolase family
MRRRYKILIVALVAVLVVFSGFVIWAETPPPTMQQANDASKSDANVTVSLRQWLVFDPVTTNYTTGFIFYPGGRVNYLAYAPYAHAIAAEGYLVVIVPMPLNLAVFGANSANDVIAAYPNTTSWAIGGHSLGGTMAAQYIHDNPNKVEGLALWASYPPSGVDLSTFNITVVTVHGTNDGLVSSQQIDDSLKQLPPDTIRVEINGGNHAQFGWYGPQSGDNPATISRDQQQDLTINASAQMLGKLQQFK